MLYLLIIVILLIIYYKLQKTLPSKDDAEDFTDNIFSHVVENNYKRVDSKIESVPSNIKNVKFPRPSYLPHKISNYYYCGQLDLHPYNKEREIYLYGRPIESVHNLYSYSVFFIENNEIVKSVTLNPHKKFNYGDPIFIRDGPDKSGPYFLF